MKENLLRFQKADYYQIVRAIEKDMPLVYPHDNELTEHGKNTQMLSFDTKSSLTNQYIKWSTDLRRLVTSAIKKGIVQNAIVHGSYGDFSATNFSDVEITLVISNQQIRETQQRHNLSKWLRTQLYPLILRIDPLQHHGAFFLWSDLINNYNEYILPLSSYQDVWAVVPMTLNFTTLAAEQNMTAPTSATIKQLRNYQTRFFKHGMSMYAIKRLLSNILLLPVLAYQSRGEMISKREALELMQEEAPSTVRQLIQSATNLRTDWASSPRWLGRLRGWVNQGTIPSNRLDVLLTSLYRRPSFEEQCRQQILPAIPDFCTYIEQRFLHE